jgi:hypothetical protein
MKKRFFIFLNLFLEKFYKCSFDMTLFNLGLNVIVPLYTSLFCSASLDIIMQLLSPCDILFYHTAKLRSLVLHLVKGKYIMQSRGTSG